MKQAITILHKTRRVWQLLKVVEGISYGLGIGLFVLAFTDIAIALATAIVGAVISIVWLRPWSVSLQQVASLFDWRYKEVENSSQLLIQKEENLSLLGKIQRHKIADRFKGYKPMLPPHRLTFASVFVVSMMLLGFGVASILPESRLDKLPEDAASDTQILNRDSTEQQVISQPQITKTQVSIYAPNYTGVSVKHSSELNIEAIEGSRLKWTLTGNDAVDEIRLETSGKAVQSMRKSGNEFTINATVNENGFYNFRMVGKHGDESITDLYRISMIEDQEPTIEISGIRQYNSYNYDDEKKVVINALIQDDFGLQDAYIVATVAKGSGESVKFREEKLQFNVVIAGKQVAVQKTLDLDQMDMTPGDELYFYVEAVDNKYPENQKTRTETYFLTIRDTTNIEFSLAGSLGVDLMPEYFRSQRQIIIDTEKLIEDKSALSQYDFNFKSNELGFDQKALRLKYGQFMGVEDESGIAIETEEVLEEVDDANDDPLADYSHDHDGDNEHNLVADDHDGEEDPLEEYMHDHDDPEEATLYTQSTRSMLKEAMAQMWDAELYLRLYEPEKSLPYQYKALELIKKIKNHARIYVHRIGFDPPPIKEDKRLSGDLEAIRSTNYSANAREIDQLKPIRDALSVLEGVLVDNRPITSDEFVVFENAAIALAPLAIDQPILYLKPLELLKKLTNKEISDQNLKETLKYLSAKLEMAVPVDNDEIISRKQSVDALTKRYLEELNSTVNE